MIREWIAPRKSLAVTAASGLTVAALVAAIAIVSTGYMAQKLDLNDASVWVANGNLQAVGRANTQVLELNSVMPGSGSDVDLLQSGSTVLVVDRGNSRIDLVDAATSTVDESVPLPPDRPVVLLSGRAVVILEQGTGDLWVAEIENLGNFDPQDPPTLSLGPDALASIDEDGVLFALSHGAGEVYRIHPAVSDEVISSDEVSLPDVGDFTLSSVGGEWVILDARAEVLHFAAATADLASAVGAGGAALQLPAPMGDEVLVAHAEGLASVPLGGTSVTAVVSERSGVAARPVIADGCAFAAWTDGQAWRRCADDTAGGSLLVLPGMPAASLLGFRTNGERVLLNDSRSGSSWAVAEAGQLIDNWEELIPPEDEQEQLEENDDDTTPQIEKQQVAPVAVDDSFGARPGRATVLPVLLNDYDANGDVLIISEVGSISDEARVDLINDRQQLQLTLGPNASGVFSFQYGISDGRGGSAVARVEITVRGPEENGPPQQVRSTKTSVAVDGRVSTQVLGDWIDPDGDAFYLTAASVPLPDAVSFKPQGSVVFSDSGQGAGVKAVSLAMSDGRDIGTGSLTITVMPHGDVPIVADPFVVLATAGQQVVVAPLDHVRGGSSAIRLNSVPAKVGVTVTPSYEAGTFRFSSEQIATHYLEYVVTDGDQTVTGVVRMDVVAPPDPNARPITIPKTVFVREQRNERIDVAASDIDPAGGVLVVTGILNLDERSGVAAEVLEQRVVRVRLEAPLDGPVTFNYRISNGLAEAQGEITVVEIPLLSRLQPPVANDDKATTRVGAAIDIPVLANDEQPDGEELSLAPTLAESVPEDAGLLFVSGNVLRYLAPESPGNYTAVYEVLGPDGQSARAQLKIAVREADAETNNAPFATPVTARALAGETVDIKIPLSGTDPDGDSVRLLGQETSPDKGSVTVVGADVITYRAGDYSAGTDTFTYTLVDALGARSTGTVRVGISARLDGARNPVAIVDEVVVRPGATVAVRALANDSDPDGSPLHLVSAVPNDEVTIAEIDEDLIVITPPEEPGTYGVVYEIENDFGGTSTNFVRVRVDPDAPLSYPVASDTVLTLTDVLERDSIDVDVLGNVFFADGNASTLGVAVHGQFGATAQVIANKRIRVSVTNESQIIPFRVTHPDDPAVYSFAFIWVPGTDDALPQINRNALGLVVMSEEPLEIDLNDYVIAVGGEVRLTDRSLVSATHANGDELVIDDDRLKFTSADHYFGPASISFEVTDGTSATDPNGRKSIIVLPIDVRPRENQPPVFTGAAIQFEPAEEREIDLLKLTNYPHIDDIDELAYTVLEPLPVGFTYSLAGQSVILRADESAVKGTVTSLSIGVEDGLSIGQPGRILLTIVPSTRPLAQPAPDNAVTERGKTTVIDVLANDYATNPFPGQPMRVVQISGMDGASLPAGVEVSPNEIKSLLTVTVATSAEPMDTNLRYQLADATGDPDRYVWGTVRISVQDKPDPVTDVRVTEFGDRRLTASWNTGAFNNSPITGYTAVLTSADTGAVISTTDCAGSLCQLITPGNGPDHAVRIAVTAENAIGTSDPASNPGPIWSDIIPAPPTDLASTPLDHGLRVTWTKPAGSSGGSAITRYVVSVDGASPEEFSVPEGDPAGTAYSRSITHPSIQNGSSVAFSVSARNKAFNSLAQWNRASGTGTPAGAPIREAAPTAAASVDDGTTATLSWPGAFSSNGRAISNYYAAVFPSDGEAPNCGVTGAILPGSPAVPPADQSFKYAGISTTATFSELTPNQPYKFVVFAFNGMGCTDSWPVEATPRARPGTVSSVTATGPHPHGDYFWDYRLDALAIAVGPAAADSFVYRLSGGTVEGGEHGPRSFGSLLEASGMSQYGQAVSVRVKACQEYRETLLCSAEWSPPFALGVPVYNSALVPLAFTHTEFGLPTDPPATGSYSWASSPAGAGYTSVTYSCGDVPQPLVNGEGGSCDVTATGTALQDFPDLVVTITANGVEYSRTYEWNDYD